MVRLCIVCCWCFAAATALSQELDEKPLTQLQELLEDTELEPEDWQAQTNLNAVSAQELRALFFLSEKGIHCLLDYRMRTGRFGSILEVNRLDCLSEQERTLLMYCGYVELPEAVKFPFQVNARTRQLWKSEGGWEQDYLARYRFASSGTNNALFARVKKDSKTLDVQFGARLGFKRGEVLIGTLAPVVGTGLLLGQDMWSGGKWRGRAYRNRCLLATGWQYRKWQGAYVQAQGNAVEQTWMCLNAGTQFKPTAQDKQLLLWNVQKSWTKERTVGGYVGIQKSKEALLPVLGLHGKFNLSDVLVQGEVLQVNNQWVYRTDVQRALGERARIGWSVENALPSEGVRRENKIHAAYNVAERKSVVRCYLVRRVVKTGQDRGYGLQMEQQGVRITHEHMRTEEGYVNKWGFRGTVLLHDKQKLRVQLQRSSNGISSGHVVAFSSRTYWHNSMLSIGYALFDVPTYDLRLYTLEARAYPYWGTQVITGHGSRLNVVFRFKWKQLQTFLHLQREFKNQKALYKGAVTLRWSIKKGSDS